MKNYYVVLTRYLGKLHINIFDAEEAKERNWVDEKGNRIWVVPPEEEVSPTFVFGFDTLDKAVDLYTTIEESVLEIVHTF